MEPTSAQMNKREYVRTRKTLTKDQLDACLSNREVQTRFKRYSTTGRAHGEGPMKEPEALEEALMDVFCGAKNRGYRLYRDYATEAHVKRMKRILADTAKGMVVNEFVPDMVDLRARLRGTSDLGTLAGLLAAEQAGRNDSEGPRDDAIRAILARITTVQVNDDVVKSHEASEDELQEAAG